MKKQVVIKKPFARMRKVAVKTLRSMCNFKHIKLVLPICIFLFCLSCSNRDEADVNPRKAILGKWELIADGLSEDKMSERNDGTYWEYLPDGTVRAFVYSDITTKTDGFFAGIGKYTIDKNFLVHKSYDPDNGTCIGEQRYQYEFNKNQLELTRNPLFIPGMSEIYIANIFIFKQIK